MANLRELIKTNQNTWSSRYISNREKERLSSQATETRSPMASHRLTMLKQIHIIRQGSYVIELQKFRMFTSEGKVDLKIPAIFDLKTLSCIMINKSIRPTPPRGEDDVGGPSRQMDPLRSKLWLDSRFTPVLLADGTYCVVFIIINIIIFFFSLFWGRTK